MSTLAYLRNLVRDRNIASVTPSSPFTVRRVLDKIDFDRRTVIVEYGPGLGVFSRKCLERMSPDSRLVLVELNERFARELDETLAAEDGRVTVVNERAQEVLHILEDLDLPCADYILSGIPFSFLDDDARAQLIADTRQALCPGGRFLVYQHYRHLERPLNEVFHDVRHERELLNVPPLSIWTATKAREAA